MCSKQSTMATLAPVGCRSTGRRPDTATPGQSRCARSLCRRQRRARCYSRRSSSAPAPSPVAIKTSSSWSGSATCLSKWFAPQVTPRHCRVTPDQERPGEAITLHRRRARAAGKMRSRVSVTSAASAECPSLMSPGPISTPPRRALPGRRSPRSYCHTSDGIVRVEATITSVGPPSAVSTAPGGSIPA